MAKKQNFDSIAIPRATTITETTKEIEGAKLSQDHEPAKPEADTPTEALETIPTAETTKISEADNHTYKQPVRSAVQEQELARTQTEQQNDELTRSENNPIEKAIDDDINMYAGITKPVSFAIPKDIKRALDYFVDDYNDARPANKTTQAKVVAQALRNFLSKYR